MSNARNVAGKIGLIFAGGIFRAALYICVAFFIYWAGRTTYQFGYDVFNQQAMSPGDGEEVTVVIPEGSSAYEIGQILESKGLVEDAKVFYAQEMLSNYKDQLQPGTYLLSTAYTPTRIMGILAGDETQEGVSAS